MAPQQAELKNERMKDYSFLEEMYRDDYFPNSCVDKGQEILRNLCFEIEQQSPQKLEDLYVLTHAATEEFNDLQEDFDAHDSEIETVARDCIGTDFLFIANAYGFEDADNEELISTRDW